MLLAKFLGVFFGVLGLGFLFNREHAVAVAGDLAKHPALQTIAGIIPLLVGSYVVAAHNQWVPNWSVLITVVGWLMLFVGIFRLWFVSAWLGMVEKHSEHGAVVAGFIALVIGALLCYVGFFGG